jgi:prepilin-type N-terminal cleavage/methylation domain-containing protein
MRARLGFTLIELMIVMAVIATIAAIAIPGLVSAQRSSNERNASASLKTLATANHDFRANDRDGNRVLDFWTGDVAGLCLIVPQVGAAPPPPPLTYAGAIRLVDLSIAGADGEFGGGIRYVAGQHVAVATALGGTFRPKSGFWYVRLVNEIGAGGPVAFMVDTDGASNANWGTCHNNDRFGFMAVPGNLSGGRVAFLMGNDAIICKSNLPPDYIATVTIGAGTSTTALAGTAMAPGIATLDYPNPPAAGWSRMD